MKLSHFILLFLCSISCFYLSAQSDKKELTTVTLLNQSKDSVQPVPPKKDSVGKPRHIPRIATERSAMIPGWGQAYNHEYWKIPIVYGALAIPTYTFFYNNSFYKMTKFAYDAVYAATYNTDSTKYFLIDPRVKQQNGDPLSLSSYQNYRNAFRRDRDYSVFWFLIVWGLNVADATVFGHLKDFDVSNDLTMHVEPSFNPMTKTPQVSFVFNLKNSSYHKVAAR
jgi:hypothetical protein